jgi:hypothetical protein
MAVTVVNLSDPISTLVTKTNTIATDLGDRASLGTTASSNLVAAINEINTKVLGIDTEAEIAAQVETFFNTQGNVLDVRGFHADSANIDSATITNLTSTNFNATKLTIDSAEFSTIKLDGAGSLSHLKSLAIKNSAGTTVLAGYILSTSNTDGTL